jgi:hypothetical protein
VKTCTVDADGANPSPVTCVDSYFLLTTIETEDDGTTTTTLKCESCNYVSNGDNVLECAQNSIKGATPTMSTCIEGSY